MRIGWALAAACLAVVSPAFAKQTDAAPELMGAAHAAQVRAAEMFSYDQAAWHATDRFREDMASRQTSLQSEAAKGLRGFVVEPDGAELLVSFYGKTVKGLLAVARYRMRGSDVVGGGFVPDDGDSVLSPLANRMIAAREAAMQEMRKPGHGLCTASDPNTLVLPPNASNGLMVYVMSSTVKSDHYPAGGHYRFDFDGDGKLIHERRFMNSCFDLDSEPRDGKRPEMIFFTHLLDSTPTEIHAFVSYYVSVPLAIGTTSNAWLWGADKGRIVSLGPIQRK